MAYSRRMLPVDVFVHGLCPFLDMMARAYLNPRVLPLTSREYRRTNELAATTVAITAIISGAL
jgi:hypothetical protein